MSAAAFLAAAILFALIAFGVAFPTDYVDRNIAAGLFLVAVGLLLPGTIALYERRAT